MSNKKPSVKLFYLFIRIVSNTEGKIEINKSQRNKF